MQIKFWDGESNIVLADGKERTIDEVAEIFPFIKSGPVVLELTRGGKALAIDSLDTLCAVYNIRDELNDDAALQAYIDIKAARAAASQAGGAGGADSAGGAGGAQ
jgi:hypothetical protein